MANSYVLYTGTGAQTNWSVPFPYISQDHVHVFVSGVEVTTGLSWPSAGVISVTPAVANGAAIKIARQTPTAALVTFQNRNNLTADNLSTAALQAIYTAVEAEDRASDSIVADNSGNFDGHSHRIVNVADPIDPQDAATRHWSETAMTSVLVLANNAATAAETALGEINVIYLGQKAADPTVDNNGSPLQAGAFYFNTVSSLVRMWNGTVWTDAVGAVQSFNGRTGSVAPTAGDYTAAQITNAPSGTVGATTLQGAINELDSEKAPASRQVLAGGLVTGGGDLSADRTLTVTKSSQAQARAGTDDTTAMTPARVKDANGMVLLDTQTISNQASLTLTTGFDATYDSYEVHLSSLTFQNDDIGLHLRVQLVGGSVPTSNYAWSLHVGGSNGSTDADTNSAVDGTAIRINGHPSAGNGIGNAAGKSLSGIVRYNSPSVAQYMNVEVSSRYIKSNGNTSADHGGGAYIGATTAISGLVLFATSGNLATGTVRVYGIRKQ